MEVERSAASVEEALEAALSELGVTEQEAEIEILQEPRSGFLGLKQQDAIVRVRARRAALPELTEEELEEQADIAADFLEELFDMMELDADVETNLVDGVMYVDVWALEDEDEMGILIGKHGATLDAVQELVRGVVNRETEQRCRVMVDVEDYRKRRRSQIAERAANVAHRVKRSGRPEALEPMNAWERKVVHDAVAKLGGGLETASEGEDPERRVVIRRSG
ncbi:MAG TPA: RNA-binding cell elongation regulator Jag/EloR [Actinomycetota bacterium]|nr:RNA-binding cell elongation regulator Jag/EloR [Actinomycetota bacterium]